jgi:SAM-dependent methyltransferase
MDDIDRCVLDVERLRQLQQRPPPFEPGEPLFWDDPHISKGMLASHLNPNTDAASRRPETIERSVVWLVEMLGLRPGDAVLDLGCGPGLYATRLAARGLRVTGVDYSRRSIDYATRYAADHGLDIAYRYQDYLTLEDERAYDAALLINGDYCPLAPEQRSQLLANVRRALVDGGRFALDVTTREHRALHGARPAWYAVDTGFWKPGPHLVLEQGFDYPEQSIYLDQYVIVEPDGTITAYRNWFQDYVPETIQAELEAGGFAVQGVWGDLTGTPYAQGSEWIGLVAQKA